MAYSPPSMLSPARACLVLALLLFVALGFWQSRTFMVWSEEMIVHAQPAAPVLQRALDSQGQPQLEPSCLGPDAPWLVHSSSRPTLNLCARGRAWPLMIAPYFSGYLYWPFALLAPLHHDDPFTLRLLGMILGLLSIGATWVVVRRLAGDTAAAFTALASAVMPCFLLVHATLEHFETLPWIWLMAALISLLGVTGLSPKAAAAELPTRRLVLAALFVGLALATNLKTLVLLAALGALALRLGVQVRRITRGQWARMVVTLVIPLSPMIALSFAPSNGYGDKSSGWTHTLAEHLFSPRWLVSSARALVLLWADVASYFADFIEPPTLQVFAVAVAVASLGFVLIDTARTLLRGHGCPVTAGAGVILLAFTVMVALLYESFPSNFTPLHTVFGVSVGVAAARLVQASRRAWVALPVGAAAIVPFAVSSVAMISSMADIKVHTNADAEQGLWHYLEAHGAGETPVVTADVMLAGVLDALSHGRVVTLRAHEFFSECRPMARNLEAPACLEQRWRLFLPYAVKSSARFVAPADWSRWGSGHLSYVPSLEKVAAALGYRVTLEQTFSTRLGVPALSLYRLERE